jgi:hypothetical protein
MPRGSRAGALFLVRATEPRRRGASQEPRGILAG